MITEVVLPQMGLEVSEGAVMAVMVAVGDSVAAGDTVCEVETDKAIAEVAAPRAGFVTAIEVEVGETVPVGAALLRIGDSADEVGEASAPAAAPGDSPAAPAAGDSAGEREAVGAPTTEPADAEREAVGVPATEPADGEAAADAEAAGGPADTSAATAAGGSVDGAGATTAGGPAGPAQTSNGSAPAAPGGPNAPDSPAEPEAPNGARPRRAAPIARRAAAAHGIGLELVTGTGPAGRITLGDVERTVAERGASPAAPAAPAAPSSSTPAAPAAGTLEPLSATRASIARRLAESQLVPQYVLSREIDAGWLLAEKSRLTAAGPVKVGVVDLLLQALAETLSRHPRLAASFVPPKDGEPAAFRHPEGIDLGLAVATDRGLLVPAIRRAHERTLAELVLERSRVVELTRAGRLGPADMGGAAATLSSLGTFGVDSFTAMLNPGESSILAVGRTVEKAVPRERGIAVVPTLSLSFTFDHRVVDGASGGAALSELAELLEGGMAWRT